MIIMHTTAAIIISVTILTIKTTINTTQHYKRIHTIPHIHVHT